MPVPLFDTATPLAPLRADIDAAVARVIDSSKFILGPEVGAFEQEFATYCGARQVFCDVDPETFCVTPDTVRAALTPRTKAVIVVHLFGNIAPVAEIAALGVPVVEDAAQAAGSTTPAGRPGALGTLATFSFFPSKNLGCFGDGGAVTTRDAEVADRVRMLRFHGSWDKVTYEHVGYNSRLDELQAAILRVQLP